MPSSTEPSDGIKTPFKAGSGHVIIAGDVDSGKSTFLWNTFCDIKDRVSVSGWISPPYHENGRKCGQDIVLLRGSEIVERLPLTRPVEFAGAFQWRRIWFNSNAFTAAGGIVADGRGDVFVVDEVGPLELEDGLGFAPYLGEIYSRWKNTVTVVRNECAERLIESIEQPCRKISLSRVRQ